MGLSSATLLQVNARAENSTDKFSDKLRADSS